MRIYEINTMTWLFSLSVKYGHNINLDNIPDEEWQTIADLKFTAVWLMGVWERSLKAIEINQKDQEFMDLASQTLPDFNAEKDLIGSAYSVSAYRINKTIGNNKDSLVRTKAKLNNLGLKLILDFVPNHVSLDHQWSDTHPEYFIQGTSKNYQDEEDNDKSYKKIGSNIYALARDPKYKPWNDVLQLNIFSDDLRKAQINLLDEIAVQCDGVRCDMAMLMLSEIFSATWKEQLNTYPTHEYWQQIIQATKKKYPNFIFIAECYWNTQDKLIELGFDYCYDKEFSDYLFNDEINLFRQRISQPVDLQKHYLRFIENHDEPRVASLFSETKLKASAVILMFAPGAKLMYEGQLEGRIVKTLVQLGRDPVQSINWDIYNFYVQLMLVNNEIFNSPTSWQIIDYPNDERIIIFSIKNKSDSYFLIVTNWSSKIKNLNIELNQTIDKVIIIFNTLDLQGYLKINQTLLSLSLKPYQALIMQTFI